MHPCTTAYKIPMPEDTPAHVLVIEPLDRGADARLTYRYDLYVGDTVMFAGETVRSPAGAFAPDPPDAARGAIVFLSCLPGDVGDEYFAGYTPEQIAWRDMWAEDLGRALVVDPALGLEAGDADGLMDQIEGWQVPLPTSPRTPTAPSLPGRGFGR